MKKIVLLIICLFMCLCMIKAQILTGKQVAQNVYDRPQANTSQTEMLMKLINKRGRVRERKIISYSIKTGNDKRDSKKLMFFTYPGDVKGTGFLVWEYNKQGKEADRWLYLPAMKKIRRISGSSSKKDYFMGSDFTYDDLSVRNVNEDTYKLLKEENLDGAKCWVLEAAPKSKEDLYTKRISWIRQDCLIPVKVIYYDKFGNIQRELKISDIIKIDGIWIPKRMVMKNLQTGHSTDITISNPILNKKMEEKEFNVNTLENGGF